MTVAHELSHASLAGSAKAFRRLPALSGAPTIFKTALQMMAQNWMAGDLTFVLPSGRSLRIRAQTPGPTAKIVIHNYRFIRRALLAGDIGFAVVRGGGIVGDHSVSFIAEDETLTLAHSARDRGLFARGALVAARWVVGRPPGHYGMVDVLGFSDRG